MRLFFHNKLTLSTTLDLLENILASFDYKQQIDSASYFGRRPSFPLWFVMLFRTAMNHFYGTWKDPETVANALKEMNYPCCTVFYMSNKDILLN